MNTALDSIIKMHKTSKLVSSIDGIKSNVTNEMHINTFIQFKDYPCVTDYGYYGNEENDVYVYSISIDTTIYIGGEYQKPGLSHNYGINYKLILRNGAIGAIMKHDRTGRRTLEEILGKNSVTQLEQDNVKQLINRAQTFINMLEDK